MFYKIIMLYLKSAGVLIVSGILFGGLIPIMISAKDWGLFVAGVGLWIVSIPFFAFVGYHIGLEAVALYKEIKNKESK